MQLTTNVVEGVLTEPGARHFACGARHVQRDDATMALRSVPAAAMKQARVKEQALTGLHGERDRLLMGHTNSLHQHGAFSVMTSSV